MNRPAYQNASSKEEKTKLSSQLVFLMRSCGGRFVKEVVEDEDEENKQHREPQYASKGSEAKPSSRNKPLAPEWWYDVGDTYAREKVSHALRSAKDPNRERIRKKRKVVKHIPTQEEETEYRTLLQDQQQIFQTFVQQEANGECTAETEKEAEALLARID